MRALTLVSAPLPARAVVTVEVSTPDPLLRAGVESVLRDSMEVALAHRGGTPDTVAVIVVDSVDAETIHTIQAARSRTLLITTSIDTAASVRAIEAGVGGVLRRRDAGSHELVAAILAVANGIGSMPPEMLSQMLDDRERAVLRLLADGHETVEVAEMLAYSVRTVTGVVHDITRRLRLRNRAHAVAFALRNGLI